MTFIELAGPILFGEFLPDSLLIHMLPSFRVMILGQYLKFG